MVPRQGAATARPPYKQWHRDKRTATATATATWRKNGRRARGTGSGGAREALCRFIYRSERDDSQLRRPGERRRETITIKETRPRQRRRSDEAPHPQTRPFDRIGREARAEKFASPDKSVTLSRRSALRSFLGILERRPAIETRRALPRSFAFEGEATASRA